VPISTEDSGRPVRVVSIGWRPGLPLDKIALLIEGEGSRGADLIVLPETCRGQAGHDPADRGTPVPITMETLDGETIRMAAALARKHRTYIVCPIDRAEGARRLNSAVVLDRNGRIACIYDKIFPFPGQEFAVEPAVQPGNSVQVFSADFGKVGLAICFDVNRPFLWRRLAEQGAELVVWPSAYSGGRAVQAHAINYHYYIVTSTWFPDCHVYDLDGEELMHESSNRQDVNVTRVALDLDRCLFHFDYNHPGKMETLLRDHAEDLLVEKYLPLEAWFLLRARRPGVSARELAKQYGIEELRHYISRSGELIRTRREASLDEHIFEMEAVPAGK